MPASELSNPDNLNAAKSPCKGCSRQKMMEFVEITKPTGWEQLQADLRGPCPCDAAMQYEGGIRENGLGNAPSNFQDVLDKMESIYDVMDGFVKALGFSGYAEVQKMGANAMLTRLVERIK